MLDVDALSVPAIRFFVAREKGRVIGCGALIQSGSKEQGELKRIFVQPRHRGRGVARAIIQSIEAVAQREGVQIIRLETGIRQAKALRLYQSAGYTECGPFGSYDPDPLSIFMKKRLR